MLNVRFDYGFIGRLFGVPRKFLSQVGAFCTSFASGHQIIDVRAPAFPDPEKNPVTVGINEEQLDAFIKERAATLCPNVADENNSAADVAARAPEEVAEYEDPSDESVADKTARIGTSPFAAREDHQHRLPKNVVVVPDDFDFTQMFQTSAGTTSSYTKITLTPLKINSTTNELDWDTGNAISFEVLNARIITPS